MAEKRKYNCGVCFDTKWVDAIAYGIPCPACVKQRSLRVLIGGLLRG